MNTYRITFKQKLPNPFWITLQIPPHLRQIIAVVVVMRSRFHILILTRKSQWVGDGVHGGGGFAKGFAAGAPGELAGGVGQALRGPEVVVVVEVDLPGGAVFAVFAARVACALAAFAGAFVGVAWCAAANPIRQP